MDSLPAVNSERDILKWLYNDHSKLKYKIVACNLKKFIDE